MYEGMWQCASRPISRARQHDRALPAYAVFVAPTQNKLNAFAADFGADVDTFARKKHRLPQISDLRDDSTECHDCKVCAMSAYLMGVEDGEDVNTDVNLVPDSYA